MKIVTLCGSMRFKNEMKKIGYILETKYDMCVLQCVYNEDGMELGEKERTALNLAHFRKIEVSDAVYVVNLQGYIGERIDINRANEIRSVLKKVAAVAERTGCAIVMQRLRIKYRRA